jgi:hypothetical protein
MGERCRLNTSSRFLYLQMVWGAQMTGTVTDTPKTIWLCPVTGVRCIKECDPRYCKLGAASGEKWTEMTDTVTMTRACLQHIADALDQCKAEVNEALTFPSSPPSDTVTISRECAWLIYFDDRDMPPEIFTGCGAEDAAHKRFKMVSGNWNCTLFQSVSPSPPPPSGLREALEKIKFIAEGEGEVWLTWGTEDRAAFSRKQIIELCIAALASADDGWVKVDETHPLPDDLTWGDETLEHHAYCKSPKVLAYRRRPSAEQGG